MFAKLENVIILESDLYYFMNLKVRCLRETPRSFARLKKRMEFLYNLDFFATPLGPPRLVHPG